MCKQIKQNNYFKPNILLFILYTTFKTYVKYLHLKSKLKW